ncbi:hypothetical protein [Rhodococcus sovatensis]|uniref:Uncharacterized protein n=1 Tax=Rhodococcus sovatensis TaxID=1805840 RepID=A0ABZ2PN29_9NOCA
MPYSADKPTRVRSSEELRAAIPGWGADLDPADRPAYPREHFDPDSTGAHWHLPEQQPGWQERERSIEHARMTPVFGTSAPLHGLSGSIRRVAYRYSEGRAAHWLLLLAGDRVDAATAHLRSFTTTRPDNPLTQTGIASEVRRRGLLSRKGSQRVDVNHQWIDPILVAGPWIAAATAAAAVVRSVIRR